MVPVGDIETPISFLDESNTQISAVSHIIDTKEDLIEVQSSSVGHFKRSVLSFLAHTIHIVGFISICPFVKSSLLSMAGTLIILQDNSLRER